DDPIVADAVAPEALQWADQSFALAPGVIQPGDLLFEKRPYSLSVWGSSLETGFWTVSAYSIVHATPELLGGEHFLFATRNTAQHVPGCVIILQVLQSDIDDLPKLSVRRLARSVS